MKGVKVNDHERGWIVLNGKKEKGGKKHREREREREEGVKKR